MAEYNFSDIFDFDNDADLKKAVDRIKSLRVEYEKLIKATENQLGKVSKQQTDLNKSIQEGSEKYKKSSGSVKDYATEVENLFKQDQQLTSQQIRLTASLEKFRKEQGSVASRSRDIIKLQNEEVKLQRKLIAGSSDQAASNARLKVEIQEKRKAMKQEAKEALGLVTVYQKQSARLNSLRKEYKDVALQEGINSKSAQEYRKEIEKLDTKLKEVDASAGQYQRNVGNYPSDFNGASGAIKQFAGRLGGVIGIAGGVGAGIVALSKEVLQFQKNLKAVQNVTGATGLELEELTVSIKSTADVFDVEFNETLQATNALVKQFGIDGAEATDLIQEGLARGLNINGEFLDSLKEYSTQFDEAGLSARTLVEVIAQSTQQGIFSDKGVDAIKEANIRIRELTPATRDALNNIGLSASRIEKELEDGSKSVFEIIQEVSERLDELPEQSREVGTAIADIFGGAGEDAGLSFLKTLKDIDISADGAAASLTEYQQRQLDVVEATEEYNSELAALSTNFEGFSSQFSLFIAEVKTNALSVLNDLLVNFTSLESVIGNLQSKINSTNSIPLLTRQLEQARNELEEVATGAPSFADQFAALFSDPFDSGNKAIQNYADRVTAVQARIQLLTQRINFLKESQEDSNDETDKSITKTINQAEAIRDLNEALASLEPFNFNASLPDPAETLKAVDKLFSGVSELDLMIRDALNETGDEEVNYLDQLETRFNKEQMIGQQRIDYFRSLQSALVNNTRLSEEEKLDLYLEYEEQITDEIERQNERRKGIIEDSLAFTGDLINGISGIIQGFKEQRLVDLEEELQQVQRNKEAIEERYAREIDLAGNNEDAQEAIERRKQERLKREEQREIQLQKKIAAAEQKKAKFQKANNIAQSFINTALAVTSALPNIPLSIAIGVIGGIETAAIAAQPIPPIPAFAKGTDSAPAGLKRVGEKGTEMYVDPQGNLGFTPDSDTVVDDSLIPKGSKIYTADQTKNIVRNMEIVEEKAATKGFFKNNKQNNADLQSMFQQKLLEQYEKSFNKESKRMDELASKMEDQILFNFDVSQRGLEMTLVKGNKRKKYINKKYKR